MISKVQMKNLYRMDRLVKKLHDLAALELKDPFATTSVDVSGLASSVLMEYEKLIRTADIRLTLHHGRIEIYNEYGHWVSVKNHFNTSSF